MNITLSPVASNRTTAVGLYGPVLTIDGIEYDLSQIPENGQAEAKTNSPFVGIITRERVMVRYEYDSKAAEPDQPTDREAYTFDVTDGSVPCPIIWKREGVRS